MRDVSARGARAWHSVLSLLTATVLLCLLSLTVSAAVRTVVEDHTLSGWDIDDGLPHNLVHHVVQDKAGFIWAATWEGAARFNGRSFTVFDRENTPGLELSGVFNFIAEDDGSLLAGTADGVYQFRQGQWRALAPSVMSGMRVNSMLRDRDGTLWVSSASKLHRLHADGRLEDVSVRPGFPKSFVTTLAQSEAGVVMVGTESGLYRLSNERITAFGVADTSVGALADDRKGGWYAAAQNGLWHVSADGNATRIQHGRALDAVVLDAMGVLWSSSPDGTLIRRDQLGNELEIKIPGLLTSALMEDQEGSVWVGSSTGLYQLSRGAAQGVAGGEGYARVIMQTEDDTIWMGASEGLRRLQAGAVTDVALGPAAGSVLSLAKSRRGHGVWVGTYDKGVAELDASGRVLRHIPVTYQGSPTLVRSVLEADDGTVWIGSGWHGLYRYKDGQLERVADQPGLQGYSILALFKDARGNIWGGTSEGMFRMDTAGNVRRWAGNADVPAMSIFDFHEDPDGTLWLATDRGLMRLSGETFTVYDHRHGLPRDKIFRVIADNRGYMWLPSTRGVFRVDRAELKQIDRGERAQLAVVVVDHTDGMPGSQGNGGSWPAGWRTRAGNLLFPTATGVGMIEPARVERVRASAVPVVLQQVSVDGKQQDAVGGVSVTGDGRRLVLQYSGIDFRAPERVRYRYRMRGFDADWVEVADRTEAIYTNLPAGHYTFELQAMRLPLDWSDGARIGRTEVQVRVSPPWWRHPAMVTGVVVSTLGALALLWWWRSASYRRRQQALKEIIDARTRELTEKNQQLEERERERDQLLKKLSYQASHDALTGLPNRRAADRRLEEALNDASQSQQSLCVALLDIDHFKGINDGYGHEAGDQVLRRIGTRLQKMSGLDVFSSRHGGEEFLLILQGVTEEEARETLETLRKDIAAESITLDNGRLLRYTVSIGMASYGPHIATTRQLLGTADRHLYEAKGQGRNRLIG